MNRPLQQIDFENGSLGSNIAASAIPLLVAQMLNLLYSIVDRLYIGRIPEAGTSALGGVGLCFPIIMLVTAFTNLFGLGGAPLCAIQRGRHDRDGAERVMNTAFTCLLICSIILTVGGELFALPLLRMIGSSPENLPYALSYLRIYLLGTCFSMIATGVNPYINCQGFSGVGMITVVIGALTNIILDPILIFYLHMGVAGAALATIFSQFLSALFVVRFLRSDQAELRLRLIPLSEWRDSLPLAGEIASLGLSAFVMQFTNSLVSFACNNMLARYGGAIYVSVMTIASSVRQLLEVPCLAISEGTSPVISYNYGALRYKRIRRAIVVMTAANLLYTLIVWISIELRADLFIRIFSSDTSLLSVATPALTLYFRAFIFQTFQYCGQTVFKALNKKRFAIFFSIFRKVVMVVPLTFLLPGLFGLGTDGVFMAEPISNVVGGSACFITMMIVVGRMTRE